MRIIELIRLSQFPCYVTLFSVHVLSALFLNIFKNLKFEFYWLTPLYISVQKLMKYQSFTELEN
jgi:hypothetical protein